MDTKDLAGRGIYIRNGLLRGYIQCRGHFSSGVHVLSWYYSIYALIPDRPNIGSKQIVKGNGVYFSFFCLDLSEIFYLLSYSIPVTIIRSRWCKRQIKQFRRFHTCPSNISTKLWNNDSHVPMFAFVTMSHCVWTA